jgi:hypothetical protein
MVLRQVILVDTPHMHFPIAIKNPLNVAQTLNILTPFTFTQITAISLSAPY